MSTDDNTRKALATVAQALLGKLAFDEAHTKLFAEIVQKLDGLPEVERRALVKQITDAIIDAP